MKSAGRLHQERRPSFAREEKAARSTLFCADSLAGSVFQLDCASLSMNIAFSMHYHPRLFICRCSFFQSPAPTSSIETVGGGNALKVARWAFTAISMGSTRSVLRIRSECSSCW